MAHLKRQTGRIKNRPLFSPTFTTPALGTPSAGVMTTMTGMVEASFADDAVTLAKMKGATDGEIITYDASGDPTRFGPGDDGEVVTSAGAGAVPAFEAAPTVVQNVDVSGLTGVTCTADAPAVIVDSSEMVNFIPTASARGRLAIHSAGGSTALPTDPLHVTMDDGARSFGVSGTVTSIYAFGAWQTSWCDRRAKKNIKSLTNILPEVEKLNLVNFHWRKQDMKEVGYFKKEGEEVTVDEKMHYGVIAQEIQEIFPTLVYTPPDDPAAEENKILHLRKEELVYIALQAIKELSAKNDALNVRALALESA